MKHSKTDYKYILENNDKRKIVFKSNNGNKETIRGLIQALRDLNFEFKSCRRWTWDTKFGQRYLMIEVLGDYANFWRRFDKLEYLNEEFKGTSLADYEALFQSQS